MIRTRRNRPEADWQKEHYFGQHTALVPARVGIEYVTGYGVRAKPVRPDLNRSPQVLLMLGAQKLDAGQRFIIWLNKK